MRAIAVPAAPRPSTPTRARVRSSPARDIAFVTAASAATAVPCWSSCSTGISSSATSRSSTWKHAGDSMSSSWIAPKPPANRFTVSTMASGSRSFSTIGQAEMPMN